ncbi:EAL domain-containing protein [Rhodanobacter sp. C03]|uniref:putative bifunctional diguanylate cyclase/phosphodiesterase n=1 Tax=Rhodanobacter sp. C03 TaxID=1945858 RepID=UPI00143C4E4C|nr:EAL domain-containing protein [Rhodanobacter sp. C03]
MTSLVIATLDSYVSFSVARHLARSRGTEAFGWLLLGALTMGIGVWSMHFIGMLAFDIGTPLGYDAWLTLLSVAPIVVAAGAVMWMVSHGAMPPWRLLLCGVLLGGGIGAMHYTGMFAMRMDPGIVWNYWRVALSVLFAIAGSTVALGVAMRVTSDRQRTYRATLRWVAATLMGCSIAGMHYLAMSAAEFPFGSWCLSTNSALHGRWLGLIIAIISLCMLLFTLSMAVLRQRIQRRESRMDAALTRAQNALTFQAFHDGLTGLPNRTYLLDTLRQLLKDSREPIAVLFVDLDGFKAINDSFGHHAGDEFLRSVAHALRASVRERDIVARFGGDEFVLVLRAYRNTDNLNAICQQVLDLVSRPVVVAGHTVTVSPSIGVAVAPADGEDADTLMRNADTAMYTVKELGKSGFRFFERSMHTLARERLTLSQELREALHLGAIDVHYQPQNDLRTGKLAGLEALARWNHPTRGMISPTIFVPIAERAGLVAALDAHVLQTVIEHLKCWKARGFEPPYVAINLSPQELREPMFADNVHETVVFNGIDPARIRFEITESTAMHNPEVTLRQLRQLRQKGFLLSIDDFGTGYSSLSYLRQLPTGTVKIDQSFIQGSSLNREDREITEAIVALSKKLHLETVAEGVESEAQATWLKEIGCDVAQGFFFARPMEKNELLRHLGVVDITDQVPC